MVSPIQGLASIGDAFGLSKLHAFVISHDGPLTRSLAIPPRTLVRDVVVIPTELFNAGTNNLLNIGLSADPDGIVDDAILASGSAFAAGEAIYVGFHANATVVHGDDITDTATTNVVESWLTNWVSEAEGDTLEIAVTMSGTAATAGRVVILVELWSFTESMLNDGL